MLGISIMNSDRLQVRYTGPAAANYDENRKYTPRYHAEEKAFAKYFEQVKPQSVIDCPFGTGRWLDYYRNINGPVIAIDLSNDMLAMAQRKISDARSIIVRFVVGSVFDCDFSQFHALKLDILVCTRFLNWVSVQKAREAISNLSKSGTRWAIIGSSVRPDEFSPLHRLQMKQLLSLENLYRRRERIAIQHVHDEGVVLDAFQSNGWQVVSRTHIFSNPTRENYFWLLKRRPDCI